MLCQHSDGPSRRALNVISSKDSRYSEYINPSKKPKNGAFPGEAETSGLEILTVEI